MTMKASAVKSTTSLDTINLIKKLNYTYITTVSAYMQATLSDADYT